MADFTLTEEQLALQALAHDFSKNEILPVAKEYDESAKFPWPVIEKAHEIGIMNHSIPKEFGGLELSNFDGCLICEEWAWGCMAMATSLMVNDLGLYPIVMAGTKEQKERFLKPFVEKPLLASFCLTEPNSGSDVASLTTRLKKDGDNYVLNGQKMFITNASHASIFIVFCTLDPKLRHKGFCAVVVEKNMPGLSIGKKENKMGQRASDTAAVNFDNVKIPKENLLGQEGEGFKIAMKTLDYSRPKVSICSVGVARAAFEHAVNYAKERVQFGKPIAKHQAIQFMLADMAISIEAGRLLCHKSSWQLDQGINPTFTASCAKAFCADMTMKTTTDAVQIFGGYGYSKEYPVEKLMRDAKLIQIYEGTSQIQRIVIAREVLK